MSELAANGLKNDSVILNENISLIFSLYLEIQSIVNISFMKWGNIIKEATLLYPG